MTTKTQTANFQLNRMFNKKLWRPLLLWLIFLPIVLTVIIPLIYMISMAFTHESKAAEFSH